MDGAANLKFLVNIIGVIHYIDLLDRRPSYSIFVGRMGAFQILLGSKINPGVDVLILVDDLDAIE